MVDRQVERWRPLRSPSGLPSEPPPPNDPLGLSTAPPESVTHVPGLECYPCLRPFRDSCAVHDFPVPKTAVLGRTAAVRPSLRRRAGAVFSFPQPRATPFYLRASRRLRAQ